MTLDINNLKKLALTIRMLSADAVEKANSGHPGMPMGAADYATVLWANYLRFNPKNPDWANRDRFVLSAGHGSMLLYSLLHLFGYDLPMSEIQNFRQWESKTPGHPEFGWTTGVETTTGPLGAGFGNGVGIAMSGKMLGARFGEEVFDYRVFGIVSDGDLMEGVASEAASLAGHLELGNLVYLYDDNHISIGGNTNVCFTENVPQRFESYGWYVQSCDGHNMEDIAACLDKAVAEKKRPSIICCRSQIGFGSPNKANTYGVHGSPLGAAEMKLTKENLGWDASKTFYIPPEVGEFCCKLAGEKAKLEASWLEKFKGWQNSNPDKAKEYAAIAKREIPAVLKDELIAAFADRKKDATRNLSGKAINVIAKHVPSFVGGSADLEPSTKTLIKDSPDISPTNFSGKNIRFGVREHGMGGVANGLAYTKHWIPYTATFLVFSDYMRPTLRLAALSHIQTLFIFTHDSFWVGEDGPTHEPIEHTASLRLIPNMYVYRPADGLETGMVYWAALQRKDRPATMLFSRQDLPALDRPASFTPDDILKGAYIVYGPENNDFVAVATGSEVAATVEAAQALAAEGIKIRVVSMPCVELYVEQSKEFREALIPSAARKISVEAGTTIGWERIVGSNALMIGINHYGASAPGELLAEKFGFTTEAIQKKIKGWV